MIIVFLVFGLVLLIAGGDVLVRGGVQLAKLWRVPPLVIGVTLMGFGTSLPELVASVRAALAGSPGIAVGNVVGSNIANIWLILGVAALIAPFAIPRDAIRRDSVALIAATAAIATVLATGALSRVTGVLMLGALALYTLLALQSEDTDTNQDVPTGRGWRAGALVVVGLAGVVAGAELLVRNAIVLAEAMAVPEAVIGLTLVAVGTSLPELAATVAAAVRREAGLAFGNILGSNVFNVFGIAGLTALIQPLSVPATFDSLAMGALIGSAASVLCLWLAGVRMSRVAGGVFIAAYAVFAVLQFT